MSTNNFLTGMLAFSRSIQIGEALIWARQADGSQKLVPVTVEDKGVRGQSSEDRAKNPGGSNPQSVDTAVVPSGCDALFITFNARVMGCALAPHATDSSDAARAFAGAAAAYAERGGFEYLAERYVWNILNGRFAWRNRMQSDDAVVEVNFGDKKLIANALDLDLDAYPGREAMADVMIGDTAKADLDAFIAGFAAGLADGDAFEFTASWIAKMRPGSEVWPSQEYLRAELAGSAAYKDRSRIYATIPFFDGDKRLRQASIHSQKINAAIRHIDEWHNNGEYGAIAINPYGGVQETGEVLRKPKTGTAPHFYEVMDGHSDLIADLDNPAENMRGETHFFFANLVRGGVFGRVDPEKQAKKLADAEKKANSKKKG